MYPFCRLYRFAGDRNPITNHRYDRTKKKNHIFRHLCPSRKFNYKKIESLCLIFDFSKRCTVEKNGGMPKGDYNRNTNKSKSMFNLFVSLFSGYFLYSTFLETTIIIVQQCKQSFFRDLPLENGYGR